jgi:GT2 family glycosyltransferase
MNFVAGSNISRIAVLVTCHNRRDLTVSCLNALFNNDVDSNIVLKVFLVDDGSTDSTADTIEAKYPDVHVLLGNGKMYWCGGMRFAFATAVKDDFDYYLWLNDDTLLKPRAISELLATLKDKLGISVGSCCDAVTGRWTYGGRVVKGKGKSISGVPVLPNGDVQECHLMNGNVVLVPKSVVSVLGLISDEFTHSLGDYDYGLRAIDNGIPLFITPNYVASCSRNMLPSWCDPHTPLLSRIAQLNNPKGIHFSEFMRFCRKHIGSKAYLVGFKVILRVLMPKIWEHKNKLL